MKKVILLLMLIAMTSLSGFDSTTMNDTVNHEHEEIDPGFIGNPYIAVDDNPHFDNYAYHCGEYEVVYNIKSEILTINGVPYIDIDKGYYHNYEIYFEIIVSTPGVIYGNSYFDYEDYNYGNTIRSSYFEVVMIDSLFDQLIYKRIEYEAEKLLTSNYEGRDTFEIKSISIVNRNETMIPIYRENK